MTGVMCSKIFAGSRSRCGIHLQASIDPASAAHLAKIAGYTNPHPEVKGDSSDLLGPQFY